MFPPEILLENLPEGEHYKDILLQSRYVQCTVYTSARSTMYNMWCEHCAN